MFRSSFATSIFSLSAFNSVLFLKADVKYLPHRLPAPNRNKKSQARRTKSKFQIEHNVKFITVDENGNCKII